MKAEHRNGDEIRGQMAVQHIMTLLLKSNLSFDKIGALSKWLLAASTY